MARRTFTLADRNRYENSKECYGYIDDNLEFHRYDSDACLTLNGYYCKVLGKAYLLHQNIDGSIG